MLLISIGQGVTKAISKSVIMTKRYFELTADAFEDMYGIEAVYLGFSSQSASLTEDSWLAARMEELKFFGIYSHRHIWTIVDEVQGSMLLSRGINFSRRLGFIATF